MGTSFVSRAVSAETAAMTEIVPVKRLMTTQPPSCTPPRAVTMDGAKPAMRKPIWVPIAMPEKRTRVENISP